MFTTILDPGKYSGKSDILGYSASQQCTSTSTSYPCLVREACVYQQRWFFKTSKLALIPPPPHTHTHTPTTNIFFRLYYRFFSKTPKYIKNTLETICNIIFGIDPLSQCPPFWNVPKNHLFWYTQASFIQMRKSRSQVYTHMSVLCQCKWFKWKPHHPIFTKLPRIFGVQCTNDLRRKEDQECWLSLSPNPVSGKILMIFWQK